MDRGKGSPTATILPARQSSAKFASQERSECGRPRSATSLVVAKGRRRSGKLLLRSQAPPSPPGKLAPLRCGFGSATGMSSFFCLLRRFDSLIARRGRRSTSVWRWRHPTTPCTHHANPRQAGAVTENPRTGRFVSVRSALLRVSQRKSWRCRRELCRTSDFTH